MRRHLTEACWEWPQVASARATQLARPWWWWGRVMVGTREYRETPWDLALKAPTSIERKVQAASSEREFLGRP
jgi:hypothetical protein